ncbi:MAG: hypothetical protein ABSG76_27745, partial [Xanthobacteraceae bacterium]
MSAFGGIRTQDGGNWNVSLETIVANTQGEEQVIERDIANGRLDRALSMEPGRHCGIQRPWSIGEDR